MFPSHYEKVRLAHGLPCEKLVRKKGHQHLYVRNRPITQPHSQSSPKALLKALREKEDQLVSFRFFGWKLFGFYHTYGQ